MFRTHLWLWHILPGQWAWTMIFSRYGYDEKVDVERSSKIILATTYKYYDQVQWLPFESTIVLNRFGNDVGNIIVDYLKAMNQIPM